jgi:hypothetical protein
VIAGGRSRGLGVGAPGPHPTGRELYLAAVLADVVDGIRRYSPRSGGMGATLTRARHDLKIAAVALFERPGPGPAISVSETTLFQDDLDATLDLLDRCHHLPVADEVD